MTNTSNCASDLFGRRPNSKICGQLTRRHMAKLRLPTRDFMIGGRLSRSACALCFSGSWDNLMAKGALLAAPLALRNRGCLIICQQPQGSVKRDGANEALLTWVRIHLIQPSSGSCTYWSIQASIPLARSRWAKARTRCSCSVES